MKRKFIVSMAVDGRIDVTVEAETPEEAFEKASAAYMDADIGNIESVGVKPVNAYDEESGVLTDYGVE